MWIAAPFVLIGMLSSVVCGWCGVGSGGGLGHGVDDTYVDVIGTCVVVCDNVESGLFVLCSAWASVQFGHVGFKLGVVAMLLEPSRERADKGAMASDSVSSNTASSCMLGVSVE